MAHPDDMAKTTPALPGSTSRRISYSITILVNAVLLGLVNGWPGWQVVPFVTEDAAPVIVPLTVAFSAVIVVYAVNLILDQRWFRAFGDGVNAALSLLVLILLWDIFPFTFSDTSIDWALVARVILGFAMAACVVSIIVNVGVLIHEAVLPPGTARTRVG